MELRHLRYFVCVAEEMHFGRAASRLGISQPPLSQQIRALEQELGVQLFDRTSRRVRLTVPGQLFLPEARETIERADHAMQTARLAHRGEVGYLSLGYTTSGPLVPSVATALYQFRQDYPDVELRLHELNNLEQIAQLQDRRLDIGLIRRFGRPALPPGLSAQLLLEEDMVIVLHEGHRLVQQARAPTIADLANEPLVLYGTTIGAGFNEYFIELCERIGFHPDIVQETDSLSTLLGLVAAGFGVSIVGRSLGRLHLDNLVYRPFDAPITSRLWMIHQPDLSPTARAFAAALAADI